MTGRAGLWERGWMSWPASITILLVVIIAMTPSIIRAWRGTDDED